MTQTRRTVLAGFSAGVPCFYTGSASGQTTESREEWQAYAANAQNTSVSQGSGPQNGLREVWRFETKDEGMNCPVVGFGKVFTTKRNGDLMAFTEREGTLDWTIELGASTSTSPILTDDRLIAGTKAGEVIAVGLSGNEVWSRNLDGTIRGHPTAVGERVYAPAGETIHALRMEDGRTEWSTQFSDSVNAPVAVAGGSIYAIVDDHGLFALDAGTGDVQWQYKADFETRIPPIVAGESIFYDFSKRNKLVVLVPDGTEKWTHEMPSLIWWLAVTADSVFVATDDRIFRLDRSTSEELWSTPNPAENGVIMSTSFNTVYTADRSRIRALDKDSGKPQSTFEFEGVPYGPPAIADGRIYVGTDAGTLYAIGEGGSGLLEPALGVGGGLAALGGYAFYRRSRSDSSE